MSNDKIFYMVSEIQAKILILISKNDGSRYSEVYPGEGIDDDLFNYHLQELVRKGLVIKEQKKYRLSEEGYKEIMLLDSRGEYQDSVKLSVILVVTKDNKHKLLFHQRLRQPYKGEISTISGKVKNGEKLIEAAKRKLKEEAGLEAEFEYWKSWRSIRKTKQGKILEDTVYNVCVAENPKGELIEENEFGRNWWGNYEDIFEKLTQNQVTGEIEKEIFQEIKSNLRKGDGFEEEIVLNLD